MIPILSETNMGTVLELLNGFWAVMAFSVSVLFICYLLKEGRREGFNLKRWWHGDMPLNMQLAVAIVVVHLGNFGVRGTLWMWRYLAGIHTLAPTEDLIGALIFTSLIAITGEICIMRVVSRTWLGSWPWMMSIAVATLFILVFH